MDWTKTVLTSLVLLTLPFAGCLGGEPETGPGEAELDVSHTERSELTEAQVTNVAGLQYRDIVVSVDGKDFTFGQQSDHELRRYSVPGKLDAAKTVETGDRILIPASGIVMIVLKHADSGAELARYEANVPDTTKPAAPINVEPSNGATGIAKLPTFRWAPVADVSGVRYQLQYSLEPTFQAPLQTVTVEDLTAPSHQLRGGNELASGFTYHWHVRAVDNMGNVGPWSETWTFTTA